MTKHPDLKPVSSSLFDGYHYDPDSRELTLKFQSGDTWRYHQVPMERAEAFAGSASPGAYFGKNIRGQYTGKKL